MYVDLNSDIYDENNKYFLKDLNKLIIDSPNQELFDRVLLHRILFNKNNIKNYNYELVIDFLFDFKDLEIKFIISKIKMIETIFNRKYDYSIIYQKYNQYIINKKY